MTRLRVWWLSNPNRAAHVGFALLWLSTVFYAYVEGDARQVEATVAANGRSMYALEVAERCMDLRAREAAEYAELTDALGIIGVP